MSPAHPAQSGGDRPPQEWMPRPGARSGSRPVLTGRRAFRRGVELFQEADAMRSLAEMADTLVEDYDVVDLLTGLADRGVELFGVSAAGAMLASPEGR